jgi:hypothetical protein
METGRASRERYFAEKAPGVYLEKEFRAPRRTFFSTGVPAFLGLMPASSQPEQSRPTPRMISLWSQFEQHIAKLPRNARLAPDWYLAHAIRGFFQNGGHWCYVVILKDGSQESLEAGLESISDLNTIDLVCVPDLVKKWELVKNWQDDKNHDQEREDAFKLQQMVVEYCDRLGDRFAILDSFYDLKSSGRQPNKPVWKTDSQAWDQWSKIVGKNGAIYYPWLKVRGSSKDPEPIAVPPCGHVAGVYSRTDRTRMTGSIPGVHKAPANEILEGVVDLERHLTSADQDYLNSKHVNCIRSFPGRGIRVWGARTLSGHRDWTYINVRRVFLTAVRWINWNMTDIPFEPNNPRLWKRIERELYSYFAEEFRAGALKGRTPGEAFYVKCDAETNPPELRDQGQVVTEIGLAPTIPYEFVVVRLIHGTRGATIAGPTEPETLS